MKSSSRRLRSRKSKGKGRRNNSAPNTVIQSVVSTIASKGNTAFGIPGNVPAGAICRLSTVRVTFALSSPVAFQLEIYDPTQNAQIVALTPFRILANGSRTLVLRTPKNIPFTNAASGQDYWGIRCSESIPFVANNTWVLRPDRLTVADFISLGNALHNGPSPSQNFQEEDVDESSTH